MTIKKGHFVKRKWSIKPPQYLPLNNKFRLVTCKGTHNKNSYYHKDHERPWQQIKIKNKGAKIYKEEDVTSLLSELERTAVGTTIHSVTAVLERQPPRCSPPGSSHTCIPPLPSLFSPGLWLPHSAGARPQCGPWMGRSGSRGTCGAGRPS